MVIEAIDSTEGLINLDLLKEKPKELKVTKTLEKFLYAWTEKDSRTDEYYRHLWSEGGTWSSKTFSAMQMLVFILENWKDDPLLCTVSSESLPHLKRGVIRDFDAIMGAKLNERNWNKTDFVYTWPYNSCKMEFVSADRPEKFTGGRRDILFCNEVNHINRDAYRQADMRTKLFTICDWNPETEFWFHDEKLVEESGSFYVHSTYLDALEVLPKGVREEIEKYEDRDPNWWRVYGLGLVGKLQGLIYPNFEQMDKLPEGFYFLGLDYGYASDPTALVKNIIIGEDLYSQELLYLPGLTNDDIAREMDLLGVKKTIGYADANELKSAEELRRAGCNINAVDKLVYRVSYRIQKVNQYRQHWTKDSLNAIKEQRNYRYIEDKQHPGTFTEKTTHEWSHCMTAREFGVVSVNTSNVACKSTSLSDLADRTRPRKSSVGIRRLR